MDEKEKKALASGDFKGLRTPTREALGIDADFNSTRAVAHASFFVASVFGLFTILASMERFSLMGKIFLSFTYWFIWLFGLYSFLNFSRYSIHAQQAKNRIVGEIEGLMNPLGKDKGQEKIIRWFENKRTSSWVHDHDLILFMVLYIAVGTITFIAFLLS